MASSDTPDAAPAPAGLFLAVEEAAKLLGISRSLAYELAHAWLETNGETGLPSIQLGRRLLVKRAALDRMADLQ